MTTRADVPSLGGHRAPSPHATRNVGLLAMLLVLVEVIARGALFEGKSWGTTLAVARLLATAAVVAWFSRGVAMGMAVTIGGCVAIAGMAVWVVKLSRGRQPAEPEAFATP